MLRGVICLLFVACCLSFCFFVFVCWMLFLFVMCLFVVVVVRCALFVKYGLLRLVWCFGVSGCSSCVVCCVVCLWLIVVR